MQHYLQIQSTLGHLCHDLVEMSDFLERNTAAIDADCLRLFADGWKGAAADAFGEVREKLSGLEKATRLALLDCAGAMAPLPGLGISAVQAAQHQMLLTFGGGGFACGSSPQFGFRDDGAAVMRIASKVQDQAENLAARVEQVRRRAAGLNEDKGALAAVDAALAAVDAMRDDVRDFSTRLGSALGTCNDFLGTAKTAFSSGAETMAAVLKNKDLAVQPPAGDADMSSPTWRAFHMARVTMQIPPEYRNTFEQLCYNAPEPYRTIFFGYIDTIQINGWDGPLGIRNWPIKDQLPRGLRESSMSTPGWGIWMNIDLDDPNAPGMNYVTYGEPPDEISAPSFFSTLFHEIGHRMDYNTNLAGTLDPSSDVPHWLLLGGSLVASKASPMLAPVLLAGAAADLLSPTLGSDTPLNRLISADVQAKLGDYAIKLINDGSFSFPKEDHAKIIKGALDNIMAGKGVLEKDASLTNVNMLQYTLQQDFSTILRGGTPKPTFTQKYESRDYMSASDVYGGATGSLVRGGYSHDAGYWNGFENYPSKTRAGKMSGLLPVISPQIELIAQSFSDGMLNNKSAQAATKEYFPTASGYLDELYKEMEKTAAARMAGKK